MNRQVCDPPRERYETLDLWRGVACLMVVVYHSTIVYTARGTHEAPTLIVRTADWLVAQTHLLNAGVALFFVISGYCIAASAEGARRRGYSVGTYFVRRFRRIYPPYWAVVVLSTLFFVFDYWPWRGLLSDSPWEQLRPWWYSPSQWFGNLTLTETWRWHLFGATRAHFPGQAWTLCYEEQFYAVTGAALFLRRSAFYPALAGVTLVTLVVTLSGTPAAQGFFIDGSWLLFACGVAVFYRLNHATPTGARLIDLGLVATVPASFALGVPIAGATLAFAFAAVLPWLHRFDRFLIAAPALTPLVLCGRMCYSLYLVHQIPVKAVSAGLLKVGLTGPVETLLVTIPLSVGTAAALGWIFHLMVERRFLNPPIPVSLAESKRQPPEVALQS